MQLANYNDPIEQIFDPAISGLIRYQGGSTRSAVAIARKKSAVHKLSSNEWYKPSPKALQAIRKHTGQVNEYNDQDDTRLRIALSNSMSDMIKPDQFITGNGGMEVLDFICRGLVNLGDECIISTPTFLAYKDFIQVCGGKVVDVPLSTEKFRLDVQGILQAITEKTRLIFITSPNNPTGKIVSRAEMDELVEKVPPNVCILYDEVYHHFVTEGIDWPRALDYILAGKPIIGLHSFSKAFGLAGIRLGYAFTTPTIAKYLYNLERPFQISLLTMEAGLAALKDIKHLEKTKQIVHKGKHLVYGCFLQQGVMYWPSEGNFVLFKPPYDPEDFTADMLEQGVMVRTGKVFGAAGCIRVTIGSREAVKAFIEAFEKLNVKQ